MKYFLVASKSGVKTDGTELDLNNYQIIKAETPKEAREIYDKNNKCKFTYGIVIGEIDINTMNVTVPLDKFLTTKGLKKLVDNDSDVSSNLIDKYGERF